MINDCKFSNIAKFNQMENLRRSIDFSNKQHDNKSSADIIAEKIFNYKTTERKKEHLKEVLTIPQSDRYSLYFDTFVPKINQLTDNQISRAIQIFDNSAKIVENISSSLYHNKPHIFLTGGAVRDFIFLKDSTIKDLDFVVDFINSSKITKDLLTPLTLSSFIDENIYTNEYQNTDVYKENIPHIKNLEGLTSKEQYKRYIQCFEFSSFIRYHIAKYDKEAQAVYIGIYEEKLMQAIDWDEYINESLAATIKTKGDDGTPIDILIANENVHELMQKFDFSICKSFVDFSDVDEFLKLNPNPSTQKKLEFIYTNLNVPLTTLVDIRNKEFTISSCYNQQYEKIKFFTRKHLPRLQKKYPDFSLNFIYNFANLQRRVDFEQLLQEIHLEHIISTHHHNVKDLDTSKFNFKL